VSSSYPVPDAAVPVSAGMIVAVPAELLASPLKNGRDPGEGDRSANTLFWSCIVLHPTERIVRALRIHL